MARGSAKRREGQHRFYKWTAESAMRLADARAELDGMQGTDPRFDQVLDEAIQYGGDMEGQATRMDRGSVGRRTTLVHIMARYALAPEMAEA